MKGVSRDVYGFEVKKEFIELYSKYAPLWEKEESERAKRWAALLAGQQGSGAQSEQLSGDNQEEALQRLEVSLIRCRANACSGNLPAWQQQLRSLVQAGIPMPLRGRMWKLLLRGRSALRRVLAAYSRRNPDVGYCQGMNFVAGCLLLFMDEKDAFWSLVVLVEDLLPGYFSLQMLAPQVDQLVFKHLVEASFPRLAAHLDKLGAHAQGVSTQWFLCLFVNSLPLETCLRVWDVFFLEQCASILFRVALALVDIYAQALLATVDSVDAFSLLQNMAPMSFDSSRLIDIACIAYAQVDAAELAKLRGLYYDEVKAQFEDRGPLKATASGPVPETTADEGGIRSAEPGSFVPADGPCSFPVEAGAGEDASDSSSSAASDSWHHAAPVYTDMTTFSQDTLAHLSRLSRGAAMADAGAEAAAPAVDMEACKSLGEAGMARMPSTRSPLPANNDADFGDVPSGETEQLLTLLQELEEEVFVATASAEKEAEAAEALCAMEAGLRGKVAALREKLQEKRQALAFQEKVLEAEYCAQRNVAPFLKSPALRKVVQTFTNDVHDDFGKWANNPLVLQMLQQAKDLLDSGQVTEAEMEAHLLGQLQAPGSDARQEVETKLARTVRLATDQLVPALNEHLDERRKGNEHFRAGRWAAAMGHYERAQGIVELVRGASPADQAEIDRNRVTVALNAAAAHLALDQALGLLHEYADARSDLERVAALAPPLDGQAQQALQQLAELQAKGRAQERRAYHGMFAKP
ncbi:hypothetical protein WJX81_004746 [Elliptochloris bilobata]|uniref:Rab-GAP TBC domain-containing protein n=1 Tax=Elliptochloris bilobata TaxID=381761 RepID=A0AAW1RJ03_9CHLO